MYSSSRGIRVRFASAHTTPRRFDKASGGWVDGEAIFLRCTIWRQAAENAAESLTRGARVVVTGRLRSTSYETREVDKRTALELDVEDIGASLKFATVTVHPRPAHLRRHRPAHRHRRTTVLIRLAWVVPSRGGITQDLRPILTDGPATW